MLERLAILFPGQMIRAEDLPERYRSSVAKGSSAAGHSAEVRVLSPAAAVAPATATTEEFRDGALPRGGLDLRDHLSAIEIDLIRQALEEADGTVAEAARLLRMRRTTLVEKLRKYRLSA